MASASPILIFVPGQRHRIKLQVAISIPAEWINRCFIIIYIGGIVKKYLADRCNSLQMKPQGIPTQWQSKERIA
jgi:hypothetical protein